jgi:hypothetical protein
VDELARLEKALISQFHDMIVAHRRRRLWRYTQIAAIVLLIAASDWAIWFY